MDKIDVLIKEIERSADMYANRLEGNIYLYIYQDKFFEVYFAKDCFRHLTGVNSVLTANEFYDAAKDHKLKRNMVMAKNNDMRTCLKKTRHLPDLYRLTITDTVVMEDVKAKYMEFEIGVTNLKLMLLLHENAFIKDKEGNIVPQIYLPASFRVDGDPMKMSRESETIDCVLEKKFGDDKYSKIVFQDDRFDIRKLPDLIKEKISNDYLQNIIDYENAMDELDGGRGSGDKAELYNILMDTPHQTDAMFAACREKGLPVVRSGECSITIEKKYAFAVAKAAIEIKNEAEKIENVALNAATKKGRKNKE